MGRTPRGEATDQERQNPLFAADVSSYAKSRLTKVAAWVNDCGVPFLVISGGMVVMLLWAGSYKMTVPGADGIVPLVSNSPLTAWQFKLLGPYVGSDVIGLTEWAAALCIIAGYFKARAGIIGGLIATLMFVVTSTMIATTPGTLISVSGFHGMRYMSFLGLFLFKDIISLGASLYLVSSFGRKAILAENANQSSR